MDYGQRWRSILDCDNGIDSRIRVRQVPPTYEPSIWNVHDITLAGSCITNNTREGLNNSFIKFVGLAHSNIWSIIDSLRKDLDQVETALIVVPTRLPSAEEPTKWHTVTL